MKRTAKQFSAAALQKDVLGFWFAPGMAERWFVKDEGFDEQVRERLADHYERAARGDYDSLRETPRGCVTLCILLDQVPRNLYRDDPRAFATDAAARAVTEHAISQGFDRTLSQSERHFLYLPLEHSEKLADQERCVRLMGELDENPVWGEYAERHRDIVARFGRFPHRNKALGRQSSEEESAFLEEPNSSF